MNTREAEMLRRIRADTRKKYPIGYHPDITFTVTGMPLTNDEAVIIEMRKYCLDRAIAILTASKHTYTHEEFTELVKLIYDFMTGKLDAE